ncbi:MAG: glycosyltransferase [Ignavibacteriaceae bacterium]|jgi:hypothetical protein|nr:glycosyltransferase [Ignavibacteriaceae bacterium]
MLLAPIVVFVYNRLKLTQITIETLKSNSLASQSELFIFSDAPKNELEIEKVDQVREYIKNIRGFNSVTITEREKNFGLANSIINGVTRVVNQFGKIIVLEDDMFLSPYFLDYMNKALVLYQDVEKVISVHGYVYPVKRSLPETFFLKGADCWGWATWKRGWDLFNPDSEYLFNEIKKRNLEFDFDMNGTANNVRMLNNQTKGKIDSWAIRWHASAFLTERLTLYPGTSLVRNIGTDGDGTHVKKTNVFNTEISDREIRLGGIPVEENVDARKILEEYRLSINPNFLSKYLKYLYHKL